MDSGEESFGSPVMLKEEIFHASACAALAKNIAGAEDFGDSADDGNDLMWLDEGVEADGEVWLGGEATGYADGKT